MTKCRLACLSIRKLILPPLMSDTALATSGVTVPVLGFGIRPRGPRTRAMRPTLAIWSGVAIAASNSSQPPWIFSIRSSLPTTSAPADLASSAFSPTANTATRAVLPVPCGRLTVARTIWFCFRRAAPEPDRHLDGRVLLGRRRLLGELGRLERGVQAVAIHLLGGGAVCLAVLAYLFIQSGVGSGLSSGPKLALPLR